LAISKNKSALRRHGVTIENSPQFQLRDKIEKRQSLEEAAEIIKNWLR